MIANWGVRARVMLAAVLPMLVLAVVMTVSYTGLRLADLDEALNARGRAFARQLAAASEYAVFSGDRDALQQLATTLLDEEDVLGVSVIDRDGATLARSGRLDGRLPSPESAAPQPAAFSERGTLRIIEPIRPSRLALDDTFAVISPGVAPAERPVALGRVVVELSLERLQRRRSELLWTGVASVLFVLLGSVLLASYMSRGVSNAIRTVANTALRLGQGRLRERVPITGGGSLRRLAEGINEMAARLADARDDMALRIADATAELRMRKDEAERANLAKSRFLAAASHDLRQPMHALGLFVSELAQQRLSPQSRQIVERIATSAEAMENLLDSLLDISRLDAGVLNPSMRAFDPRKVIDRITAGQRAAAEHRGLRLHVRPAPYWVRSDPVLFERILINLVSNAIRYTPAGTVMIACRRRGDRLRLEVRDSGVGIVDEAQDIIFQEFIQLENAERARDKGLGLGLAIVRRLADLLGHRLELRSAPGRGSVFAIELPIAEPDTEAAQADEARALGDLRDLRVALVDGDALAREGMEGLLTSWGCKVRSAETAEALLDLLASGPWVPELLITDLRLRGPINGLELIARARAAAPGRNLPAFLVSGDTGAAALERAQAAGVALLHKPVRPARLRALMHRLITPA